MALPAGLQIRRGDLNIRFDNLVLDIDELGLQTRGSRICIPLLITLRFRHVAKPFQQPRVHQNQPEK